MYSPTNTRLSHFPLWGRGKMGHPHHFKPASLEPADVTSFFLTTSSEPAGNVANNSGNTLNYSLLAMPSAVLSEGSCPGCRKHQSG